MRNVLDAKELVGILMLLGCLVLGVMVAAWLVSDEQNEIYTDIMAPDMVHIVSGNNVLSGRPTDGISGNKFTQTWESYTTEELRRTRTPVPTSIPTIVTEVDNVLLTVYVCVGAYGPYHDGFCGTMSNGETVHVGAVACGGFLDLGTTLKIVEDPDDRVYTCTDRGKGYLTYKYFWIDRWFYNFSDGKEWRDILGNNITVEVLE